MFKRILIVLSALVLLPASAYAQASLTGVVKDTSGAILPGVTVEASSPVLIEKVRTAVTDSSGQYRIVDLRAGTYSLTFTLAGFSGVRRDGIELDRLVHGGGERGPEGRRGRPKRSPSPVRRRSSTPRASGGRRRSATTSSRRFPPRAPTPA